MKAILFVLVLFLVLLDNIAYAILLPGYWIPGVEYWGGESRPAIKGPSVYGSSDSGVESDVESSDSLQTIEADDDFDNGLSPRSSLPESVDDYQNDIRETSKKSGFRNRVAEYLTVVRGLEYFGRPSAEFQRPDVEEVRELELSLNAMEFKPLVAYHSLAFELLNNMSWTGLHQNYPDTQHVSGWRQYEQAVVDKLNERRILKYRYHRLTLDVDVVWLPTSLWELFAAMYDFEKKKPTFDHDIYGSGRRSSYWNKKNLLVFSRRRSSNKLLKPRKKVYTNFLEFIQHEDPNLLLMLSRKNDRDLTPHQLTDITKRLIKLAQTIINRIALECEKQKPISMSPSFSSFGSHGARISSSYFGPSTSRYVPLHNLQSSDDLPPTYITFIETEKQALTQCQKSNNHQCNSVIASTIKLELEARMNDEILLFRTTELHEQEVGDVERDARLAVWLRKRQVEPPFLQPIHELSSLHDIKTFVYEKPQNKAYTDLKPLLYSYSLLSGFLGNSFALDSTDSNNEMIYAIKLPRQTALAKLSSTFLLTDFHEHTLVWQSGLDRRPRTMYLAYGVGQSSTTSSPNARTSIQKLLHKRKIQVGSYVGDLNLLVRDNVRIISFRNRALYHNDTDVKKQFMNFESKTTDL